MAARDRDPEEIRTALAELARLMEEHGKDKGMLMFLTGLSAERIEELGGI